MQTIARSMADTGPMGGRYMPHAPPIVGRYGKRPHSRMRRLQLRTVHVAFAFPNHPAGLLVLLGRELRGHGLRPRVELGQPVLAERLERQPLGPERAHLGLGRVKLDERPFALGQLVERALLAPASTFSWLRSARHVC